MEHTFNDDSLNSRFAKLGVNPELKLSVLGGLLQNDESPLEKFLLTHDDHGCRGLKATLLCQVVTSECYLVSGTPEVWDVTREWEGATHFVSGLAYGATVVATITSKNQATNADSAQRLRSRLDALLRFLESSLSIPDERELCNGDGLMRLPNRNSLDGRLEADCPRQMDKCAVDDGGSMGDACATGDGSQLLECPELNDSSDIPRVEISAGESDVPGGRRQPERHPDDAAHMGGCSVKQGLTSLESTSEEAFAMPDLGESICRVEQLFQDIHDVEEELRFFYEEVNRATRDHGHGVVFRTEGRIVDGCKGKLEKICERATQAVGHAAVEIRSGRMDCSALNHIVEELREHFCLPKFKDCLMKHRVILEEKVRFFRELHSFGIYYVSAADERVASMKIVSEHARDSLHILVRNTIVEREGLFRSNLELLKRLVVQRRREEGEATDTEDSVSGTDRVSRASAEGEGGRGGGEGEGAIVLVGGRGTDRRRCFHFYVIEITGAAGQESTEAPVSNTNGCRAENGNEGTESCDDPHLPPLSLDTAIRFYEKGKLIHDDVWMHMERTSALCLVRSNEMELLEPRIATTSSLGAPNRTARLRCRCPGSVNGLCSPIERVWHCERCTAEVEYGYDGFAYCECGRCPVGSLRYLCRDKVHKDDTYVRFRTSAKLQDELDKLKRSEEINILLLGETGVGKSTFINAFVNYLTHEKMDDAREDLIALIPSKFTICKDGDFEECMVSIGDEGDANETSGSGKSSTQSCKAYVFHYGDRVVRLIDTPGIGDTRGIEQDKNFENILRFLGHHPEVHGICILLKPNNARLTVMFRFCIMELLSHLHKSAKDNIAFVFTNARSTFYRPGDTMPPLREMLQKIRDSPPNVDIEISKKTIYSLDNEAFRFMAAMKQGVEFGEKQKADFAESWKVSVDECRRLMKFVFNRKAHRVQDTVSRNLQVLAEKVKDVNFSAKHISDLKKQLYVPAIDLEYVALDQPHTVCTSSSCRDIVTTGSVAKYDYRTRCHKPCYLTNVEINIVNNPDLQNCAAMHPNRLHCNQCGCPWSAHMHVMTESKHIQVNLRDNNIDQQIKTKEQAVEAMKKNIKDLENRASELKKEQQIIARMSARFTQFLKSNAIAAYNDSLLEYLGHLIEEEKNLRSEGMNNAEVLNGLIRLKETYETEIRILSEAETTIDPALDPSSGIRLGLPASASPSSCSSVSAEDINAMVHELFALQINGCMIRQTMEEYDKALKAVHFAYSETVVRPARTWSDRGKSASRAAGSSSSRGCSHPPCQCHSRSGFEGTHQGCKQQYMVQMGSVSLCSYNTVNANGCNHCHDQPIHHNHQAHYHSHTMDNVWNGHSSCGTHHGNDFSWGQENAYYDDRLGENSYACRCGARTTTQRPPVAVNQGLRIPSLF
ncbi:hypothetical protein CBR_g31754 [Chara braunii]|uniref:DUF8206 domain-containing protein n=1 Tax=Chara braunii TaxID=69332 RepID=A0A388JY82_CHABU|nr:hypothetical protein CBR_g31754 [Chara braunii]|eukprot:GBG62737.1 hypothetical protein CBR_g31754 [Chara braunii]